MATNSSQGSNSRRDGGSGRADGGGRSARGGGRSQRDGTRSQRGANASRGRQSEAGVDETVAQLAGPLSRVLKRLPETQRKVLELRMGLRDGHPHDLADTAEALGLSMSEARDIEARAFAYIREAIPPKQLKQLHRFLS